MLFMILYFWYYVSSDIKSHLLSFETKLEFRCIKSTILKSESLTVFTIIVKWKKISYICKQVNVYRVKRFESFTSAYLCKLTVIQPLTVATLSHQKKFFRQTSKDFVFYILIPCFVKLLLTFFLTLMANDRIL